MAVGLKHLKSAYEAIPDHYGRIVFWTAILVGIPAAMMWLASRLWWFWQWFGWFGLAMVALVTVAIVMSILAQYRVWRSNKDQSRDAMPTEAISTVASIDWAPWKLRTRYTTDEFSRILARTDPTSRNGDPQSTAYLRLLVEAIKARKIPSATEDYGYASQRTYVARDDAISWVEEKDIAVDHIK